MAVKRRRAHVLLDGATWGMFIGGGVTEMNRFWLDSAGHHSGWLGLALAVGGGLVLLAKHVQLLRSEKP